LGCGWLGLPLACHLKRLGFIVKGSTISQDKISLLKDSGILPYIIICNPHVSGKNVGNFFDADILFLNIPFKRNFSDPASYKEQIKAVIENVESSRIDFVIFASSTSIYPEKKGVAIEDHPLIPDNPRSKVLNEIEELLLENKHFEATILRFAGLYGGERKIGRFISGQKDLDNADSPVNLVHLDDCVQIVTKIIQQDIRKEIFNVCSDFHPTRKELYTVAAVNLNLPPPTFSESHPTKFKVVTNEKLKRKLNYQFIDPDPMKL